MYWMLEMLMDVPLMLMGFWLAGGQRESTINPPFSPNTYHVQVSAGGSHNCSLRDDQSIECWGSDNLSQSTHPHCNGDFDDVLISTDGDCDNIPTEEDCDDNDNTSNAIVDDLDCDGFITEIDCNDEDADLNDSSIDADCDGVLTNVDCDDNNVLMPNQDADCDGALTVEDCNDGDVTLLSQTNDQDCDGVLTDDDCDDLDPNSIFDMDCDGYPADQSDPSIYQDCDDNDATLNHDDQDGDFYTSCDGDCDDTDPYVFLWINPVNGMAVNMSVNGKIVLKIKI